MTATCPVCNTEIELIRYGFGWIGKCRCSEFVNISDEEMKGKEAEGDNARNK